MINDQIDAREIEIFFQRWQGEGKPLLPAFWDDDEPNEFPCLVRGRLFETAEDWRQFRLSLSDPGDRRNR